MRGERCRQKTNGRPNDLSLRAAVARDCTSLPTTWSSPHPTSPRSQKPASTSPSSPSSSPAASSLRAPPMPSGTRRTATCWGIATSPSRRGSARTRMAPSAHRGDRPRDSCTFALQPDAVARRILRRRAQLLRRLQGDLALSALRSVPVRAAPERPHDVGRGGLGRGLRRYRIGEARLLGLRRRFFSGTVGRRLAWTAYVRWPQAT